MYSSYDDPIEGRWAVIVDESTTQFMREVSPSSYVCSAHDYPLDTGDSITQSLRITMARIFEETEVRKDLPSTDEMIYGGFDGYVLVRLDTFSPRMSCSAGFWSSKCTATVDMSFGIEAKEVEGERFATSVGSTKAYDGDAGMYCGDGAGILAEAYKLALKDSMERLAERASNSRRLRDDN